MKRARTSELLSTVLVTRFTDFCMLLRDNLEVAREAIHSWICTYPVLKDGVGANPSNLCWVGLKSINRKGKAADRISPDARVELRYRDRTYFFADRLSGLIGVLHPVTEEFLPYPLNAPTSFPNVLFRAVAQAMNRDVLWLWMTYLEPEELIACGGVCQAWRAMTMREELWARFPFLDDGSNATARASYLQWTLRMRPPPYFSPHRQLFLLFCGVQTPFQNMHLVKYQMSTKCELCFQDDNGIHMRVKMNSDLSKITGVQFPGKKKATHQSREKLGRLMVRGYREILRLLLDTKQYSKLEVFVPSYDGCYFRFRDPK